MSVNQRPFVQALQPRHTKEKNKKFAMVHLIFQIVTKDMKKPHITGHMPKPTVQKCTVMSVQTLDPDQAETESAPIVSKCPISPDNYSNRPSTPKKKAIHDNQGVCDIRRFARRVTIVKWKYCRISSIFIL